MSSRGGGGPSDRRKGFQRGLDADESRRKRETNIVELRKAKRDESLMKKRAVISGGGMGAGFGGESSGLGGVPGAAGGAAGFPGIGGYDDVGTMEDSTRPGGGGSGKVSRMGGRRRETERERQEQLFCTVLLCCSRLLSLLLLLRIRRVELVSAATKRRGQRGRGRANKQAFNQQAERGAKKNTIDDPPLFFPFRSPSSSPFSPSTLTKNLSDPRRAPSDGPGRLVRGPGGAARGHHAVPEAAVDR